MDHPRAACRLLAFGHMKRGGFHSRFSPRVIKLDVSRSHDNRSFMRAALTKEELHNLLFENIGLSKRECREVLDTLFEEIRAALEAGDTVKLEGFGRFQPTHRPRRWARNLKSGEMIPVAERRVVTFRPSKKVTERIERRLLLDHSNQRKSGT